MVSRSISNWLLLKLFIAALVVGALTESSLLITTDLEKVINRGEIVIITRNTPTTYYVGPEGPTGFEYDLAKAFALHLGVTPRMVVYNEFSSILPAIFSKKAQLAAAGITYTEDRSRYVNFSDQYQEIIQLVLYKAGNKKPRTIEDLRGVTIDVIHGSSHEELLGQLKKKHDFLRWRSNKKR